jgi:hypothetical protein
MFPVAAWAGSVVSSETTANAVPRMVLIASVFMFISSFDSDTVNLSFFSLFSHDNSP